MQSANFQVVVTTSSISPEDWVQASNTSASQLPKLTAEQRRVAREFKISEEEYARGEKARLYGEERIHARGYQLGQTAGKLLAEVDRKYKLVRVTSEMSKARWVLTIDTPRGLVNVFVPRNVADDVVDWGARPAIDGLRSCLAYGLGSGDPGARVDQS
jgi:hypothetical protein